MNDNEPTGQDQAESKAGWVSMKEAARLLSVNLRSVYRMVERGELVSDHAKRDQRVTFESVEAARLRRLVDVATQPEIETQESEPRQKSPKSKAQQEEQRAAVMALMALQEERNRLMTRLEEVQEARRQDALTIGRLEERVKNLEERLKAAETSQGSPASPQEQEGVSKMPPKAESPPPNPNPKKRRWPWQR